MISIYRLFLIVFLALSGCAPATGNLVSTPTAPAAPEEPMEYIYALQVVVRDWGVVTYRRNGHSRNLAITEGNAVSDESGVTFTTPDRGTFRCLYKDTPSPAVKTNFRSPPKSIVLNCRRGGQDEDLNVWVTESDSKTMVHAWKTMAAGAPKELLESTADFEALAASYRADPALYTLSEEARALRLQAENYVRENKPFFALQRFRSLLDISPWWPHGHFNLALIYGELKLYRLATASMEKYLKLVPDAPNARAAQDKIYGWRDKVAQ